MQYTYIQKKYCLMLIIINQNLAVKFISTVCVCHMAKEFHHSWKTKLLNVCVRNEKGIENCF